MQPHPWVVENMPHVVSLLVLLEALDGKVVTVGVTPGNLDAALRHRETMAAPIAP